MGAQPKKLVKQPSMPGGGNQKPTKEMGGHGGGGGHHVVLVCSDVSGGRAVSQFSVKTTFRNIGVCDIWYCIYIYIYICKLLFCMSVKLGRLH